MPLDEEIVGRAFHYNCLIAELAIYLPFQDFQARQLFPRLLLFSRASFKLWKSLVSFSLNSSVIALTPFQAKMTPVGMRILTSHKRLSRFGAFSA